jgi:hypothetical protein
MVKIGDRVGAILGAENKEISFLGYGIYEGDFFPEEAIGFLADIRRELIKEGKIKKEDYTNPQIRLDNGKVVYGCECWWGNELNVKKQIERYIADGYKIINTDIDKIRGEFKNGRT